MKKIYILVAVIIAVLWLPFADIKAEDYKVGGIVVAHPWARATAGMAKTGAAFMTIRNGGKEVDRLVAIKGALSKKVGVHQNVMENGIMKMRPAGAIEVPPGGMAMLKPGGYHIMFMGLGGLLKEGASFPLTLVFEKAGEVEVTVKVMKAGAMKM